MIRLQVICDGCGKSILREAQDEFAGAQGVSAWTTLVDGWSSLVVVGKYGTKEVFATCCARCLDDVVKRVYDASKVEG